MSRGWAFLLFISAGIFLVLLARSAWELSSRGERDRDLAVESSRARSGAERDSLKAAHEYERRALKLKQDAARDHLTGARTDAALAEDLFRRAPGDPALVPSLQAARAGFTRYLEVFPEDADVLLERAGILETLRNPQAALQDIERVAALRPDAAVELRDRMDRLRRELPR
jgi:tetratricopeptide (TPR) repeat protein